MSHIIAKFAIHKRIVLQVFHLLWKAHAVYARDVVRQAGEGELSPLYLNHTLIVKALNIKRF